MWKLKIMQMIYKLPAKKRFSFSEISGVKEVFHSLPRARARFIENIPIFCGPNPSPN